MRIWTRSISLAAAAVGFAAATAAAQQTRTADPRLYPLLGCWQADSTGSSSADRTGVTCVLPVVGSADVDMVTVVDGRAASHRRIDASGRPHAIDAQGCRGEERTNRSAAPRRIYLRSEYVCSPGGIAGGTSTLFSFLPTGEWLAVESIRSGAGSITHVERRHEVGVPPGIPRDAAAQIGAQRLAVETARAGAASPVRAADVLEALRLTDSSVVRAWLVATAQPFQLSGDEVTALIAARVPSPVLQAMLSAAPRYQLGVGVDSNGRSSDAYLSTPGWPGGAAGVARSSVVYENVYVGGEPCCVAAPVYAPYGYYVPPVVVIRGGTRSGYRSGYESGYDPSRPYGRYQNAGRGYSPPPSESYLSTPANRGPTYYPKPVGVRPSSAPVYAPPRAGGGTHRP